MTTVVVFNSDNALAHAQQLLCDEHVIAAPTDTVYGVMCRFDSTRAIRELYRVKGRPPEKAIPILLGDVSQLDLVVAPPLPRVADVLMAEFWPGPLTLVLAAQADLPAVLTAEQPTVAVRIPAHETLRQLIIEAGPLAVTSANLSGQPETRAASEVVAQLGGRIPLVLDDGPSHHGVGSTILHLSSLPDERPRFLRTGPIATEVQALLDDFYTSLATP